MAKPLERILVAEGDAAALESIATQVLEPMGYTVFTARNGHDALELALEHQPHIVFAGLDLPGVTGFDLLAGMRSRGVMAYAIVLAPKGAAEAQLLRAFRLGARDYLIRPVREAELVNTLDRALEELNLKRDRDQLGQRLSSANHQLEKRVRELTVLSSLGKAVTSLTDLAQLFTRLMDGAVLACEADLGWLMLVEESTTEGAPQALVARAAKNIPALAGLKLGAPWDDGVSSLLLQSGEALSLSGEPLTRLRAGQAARSVAATPIRAKDQILGVLTVGRKTEHAFTERELALLSSVADYASIALVNARLFRGLEARATRLQRSYNDLATGSLTLSVGRELTIQLAGARSALEPLLSGARGALGQRQIESGKQALEHVDAARRLADDLTTLGEAPQRPANPRPLDLAALAQQSIARVEPEARRLGVALQAELPPFVLKASGDATQISRVIDRLLERAIKVSPHGAQVWVRVRNTNDGMLRLSVHDVGGSFSAEQVAGALRGAPGQTPVRDPGALSLAVVRQIVEAHGGKVWAEADPALGSTVHVGLIKL
ncbi:MAG TPA: response regulator [Anaerolineales bacterium]|nr:response regulator [Anaerolineales bacterium]